MRKFVIISFLATALVGCSPGSSDSSDSTKAQTPPEGPSIVAAPEASVKPRPDVPTPPAPNGDGILTISDVDFTTYSLELASHLNLEVGEAKGSVEDKIHAAFRPNKMSEGEGHIEYALTELKAEGGSVLLATAEGLADDSVKAKQLYVIFQDDMLVTYGMKVKCRRGPSPNIWQNSLCL